MTDFVKAVSNKTRMRSCYPCRELYSTDKGPYTEVFQLIPVVFIPVAPVTSNPFHITNHFI